MTTRKTFSVIMPTHRRAGLLTRALSSMRSQALADRLEIIVISDVQDAQTDQVCHQLLGPQDTYIRRSGPPGPSTSRNIGLRQAQGEFVLFLDDDDAWHPGLLEFLFACPSLRQGDPVYFDCTVAKESRGPQGPVTVSEVRLDLHQSLTRDVYVKNQVHMSCFAFPRLMLQDLDFDPHMRAYEDWDFLLSAFDLRMPTHVPFTGSRVHEVDDQTTDRRGSSDAARDYNAVLDYLYVYRRHPVQADLQAKRSLLLAQAGLKIEPRYL